MKKQILQLGNPQLYNHCEEVQKNDLPQIKAVITDLHDTLTDFKKKHRAGRAIAAPQIGISKRLVYMHIDEPIVFINPTLSFDDDEMMEVMDDCMSFPNLLVRVMRHKNITINFKDTNFADKEMRLTGDLAELLQHECDHLDGVLATMRAIDNKSFFLRQTYE